MDSHESGAMVITSLQGFTLNGRPLRVSWGKERYRRSSNANSTMRPSSRMTMVMSQDGGLSSPPHSHLSPVGGGGHQSGLTTPSHYSPISPLEMSGSATPNSHQPSGSYTAYHQGYMVPAYGGYYGYATGHPHPHSGYSSPSHHHHPQHMGGMVSHMSHPFAAGTGYGPSGSGSYQSSYAGSPSRSGKGSSGTTTVASNSPPAPSSPSTLAK